MKLAIVAYPDLDEGDRQWIESFRSTHDPQAPRIHVHFTLVFPVEAVPSDVGSEVAMVAQSTQPIPFAIRGTKLVRDVLGDVTHIFLVPHEGGSQITTLHDRLYAGTLRAHLRADVPFVPHMTVGAAPNVEAAERLSEKLRHQSRTVRGTISRLELIDVGTRQVQSVASYDLGKTAATTADGSE